MKMYMDHSQEVGELGCREEVVQGTDTRGSVLFHALSRDCGSVNIESRSKPSCHHNSAAGNGFVNNSHRLHDDPRLTDKPMPMSILRSRDDVSTTGHSDAAVASGRRADAVGGRHRHRRHEGSSATTSSVSLLSDAAPGLYQKRRMLPLSQISRLKSPSNGNYSAVTTAVADSSSSRGGPLVITVPPPTKSNLLASPSRSRHRPRATVSGVVLDDGSTWGALGKVREAPSSKEASSSLDSYSDEDYQPAEPHHKQYQGRGLKMQTHGRSPQKEDG